MTVPVAVAAGFSTVASTASAVSPRTDVTSSWMDALDQFAELELEEALATVETGIAAAEAQGYGDDPTLAAMYVLKGGLEHSLTGNESKTMASFTRAVQLDWNVQLPIEMQSNELVGLLGRARESVPKPGDAILHTPPQIAPGGEVNIGALANMVMPEGSTLVIYYRQLGSDGQFTGEELKLLNDGSMGEVTLGPETHGDKGLEYFFYVLDASQQPVSNFGDQEHPIQVEVSGEAAAGGGGGGGGDEGGGGGGTDGGKTKRPKGKSDLPRVFINLGVGTGFGIARGTAELTYLQYRPGTVGGSYGTPEQACALARWKAAGAPLPATQAEFSGALAEIQQVDPNILPADPMDLTVAYDEGYCSRRHPVSTGVAPAPFHISPEVGVRVANRIVLSLFGRLQVVTGSKVFEPDPKKDLFSSFTEDVRSPSPQGVQIKHKFTWAIGAKFKYFIGKQDRKFKLYTGLFAGYGITRLRVNMNFSNDRNGNSVADEDESAVHGDLDLMGSIVPESCRPVWPYNTGCDGGNMGPDILLAEQVRLGASSSDLRIDTVRIGPGFVGGLFGFHYQIVKYFGVYAEADLGGWFPQTSSLLFDINLGPALTF